MKYPSEYIRTLADKADIAENWVLERDWSFWRWAEYKAEAETLREQRDAVLADYRELNKRYREETGNSYTPSKTTTRLLMSLVLQETRGLVSRWLQVAGRTD